MRTAAWIGASPPAPTAPSIVSLSNRTGRFSSAVGLPAWPDNREITLAAFVLTGPWTEGEKQSERDCMGWNEVASLQFDLVGKGWSRKVTRFNEARFDQRAKAVKQKL